MMACAASNQLFATFVSAGGYHDDNLWSDMGKRWRDSKSVVMPAFWGDAHFDAPEQPVVGISWYEALAFSAWLSAETGQKWRLPTEVEWEVTARLGVQDKIHSADSGVHRTLAVHQDGYQSTLGIWHLLGNVWEWCSTRWGRNWQHLDYPYPYDANDGREDLAGSHARVMRGGSWFDTLQEAHPSKRARYLPGSRGSNIGF